MGAFVCLVVGGILNLFRIIAGSRCPIPGRFRRWALRASGYNVGLSSIGEGCLFGVHSLSVGDHSLINHEVMFYGDVKDPLSKVVIGMNTLVAPRVTFITDSHRIGTHERRGGKVVREEIVVGHGCWIGAGAIIFPGVTIGDGAIVGAGAVVNKDVPADSICVGVPARVVKRL